MRSYTLWILTSCLLTISACGKKNSPISSLHEAWLTSESPTLLLGGQFEDRFEFLPTSGSAEKIPWADSYWPNNRGGISSRWQAGYDIAQMPSRQAIARMSPAQINLLSPAEKYDLYQGQYDYPLTRSELQRTSPNHDSWWGLCHGLAPASVLFEEPRSLTVQSPEGFPIQFASSDIKALLTYAQQYNRQASSTLFMANRCYDDIEDSFAPYNRACEGVNPGAMHIVFAELLGRQKQSVIVDIEQGYEVWNYPAISYRSNILSESRQIYDKAAPGTFKIIEVNTTVQYVQPIRPIAQAIGTANLGQYLSQTYRYTLEIDRAGRIIGGEWLNFNRPDFLWLQTPFEFRGYFARLQNLYLQSIF